MSGYPNDNVKRSDFAGQPVSVYPEAAGMNRNYLGAEPDHISGERTSVAHVKLQAIRFLLTGPYPQGPSTPQQSVPSVNRVHYPPSPYIATARHDAPADQHYTSIPLNDESPSSTRPSRSTSPNRSGANTPNGGRKKPWSFLPMHGATASGHTTPSGDSEKKRPKNRRNQSWDLLGDKADWEEYNPAKASVENLRFAEGDAGTTKLSRFYYWALNRGIAVRWALYIIPFLALLWIPGIVGLTAAKDATIWGTHLLWWSVWLSVVWGGFWASTAVFMIVPAFWRNTVGTIIPGAKKYTDIIGNLGRYAKLVVWSLAMWVSFTPIIINNYTGDQSATSRTNLTTIASLLFGVFLCSIVFGVEKLVVQLIALQFHQDSYEDRLKEQKFQIRCLTTLYINSRDIPGRTDTLTDAQSTKTKGSQIPKIALRKALRGLREVAQTTTTALGNVASEMAGQSVLQTNSPSNRVTAALTSFNKSKALARRLFYSFRQPGADHVDIADIARFFPDLETAQSAFAVFDQDGNGDATRDEIESAVVSIHRDRLSLEASMRDLDGAVRRLDDIFMAIVLAIWILIMAAMVTTKLTTLVTSAGTFILGLSWLIGTTMQEILLSCIFLFVKHPYDVGDRVDIDGNSYTVAKMQLLSTSFRRVDGKYVWIGHTVLAAKVIENVRRSGPTHETFTFEVAFDTSFEALQSLRARMLHFCKENGRDFLPIFDVVVDDIPGQGKMVLKADIKYKSNWQQGALKVQRRNKWICALKMTLMDLKIWGPAGAGDPAPPPPDPVQYTLVPYEIASAAPKSESPPPTFQSATAIGHTATSLTDRHEIINDSTQDIWDEQDELGNASTAAPSRIGTPGLETPMSFNVGTPLNSGSVNGPRQRVPTHTDTGEAIEMTSAPVARRDFGGR
ncbi:hypothetical protein JCM24511_01350 [Saitozyma sp. JCM 24511]|nr:hypothetical protein JCM24511_01350 [Saitozyma sp. JCM 24511]